MILNAIILFLSVAGPGILLSGRLNIGNDSMRFLLIFAASYLFSMTIIHLIPDLFISGQDPFNIGLWILLGFFFQKVLENFTSGVEHGHAHVHGTSFSVIYLLIALSIHSFLEGSIMSDSIHANHLPVSNTDHGSSPKVLFGIIMHKIPAAIALAALLIAQLKSLRKVRLYMLVFALASPLGLLASEYLSHEEVLSPEQMIIFFGIVAGGFLQISTTMFIETDPNHKLSWKRFSVALLGAGVAVLAQLLI